MSDQPPSRPLRLFFTGVLILFLWGMALSVAEDVRSDTSTSHTIARSSGARLSSGRFSAGPADLVALPPRELDVGVLAWVAPAAFAPPAPSALPGEPPARTSLPRAPPRHLFR